MKKFARRGQLSKIFELDRVILKFDGIFVAVQGVGLLLGFALLLRTHICMTLKNV